MCVGHARIKTLATFTRPCFHEYCRRATCHPWKQLSHQSTSVSHAVILESIANRTFPRTVWLLCVTNCGLFHHGDRSLGKLYLTAHASPRARVIQLPERGFFQPRTRSSSLFWGLGDGTGDIKHCTRACFTRFVPGLVPAT